MTPSSRAKRSANLSAIHVLVPRTCSAWRGRPSSRSWRAVSPVQMTKSIESLRLASIQSNVAFTREKGLSQSVVSAPKGPAGPLPRWHAPSSSVDECAL
jgi:hypothetical protein